MSTATEVLPATLVGSIVIDRHLGCRGVIIGATPEALRVTVQWKPGQWTALRPDDIRAGRYLMEVRQR